MRKLLIIATIVGAATALYGYLATPAHCAYCNGQQCWGNLGCFQGCTCLRVGANPGQCVSLGEK